MLPPGQPTLLVGAMHAGEIDTVLDQSVKATADVDLWHLADNQVAPAFVRFRMPPQPVDATQTLNLSAGVSNCKVLRGRSLS
jgi:hypothetical protein